MRATILGVIGLLCVATMARAGIFDSPIPAPFVHHLYSVPGVMNDDGTTLSTFFSCTSTSTSPQTVGVELFAASGGAAINNAATTAVVLPAGGTVTFGTSGSAWADVVLGNPAMSKGSARILSTAKSLICSAFVADAGSITPESGFALTISKKTKQKGD